MNYACLIISLRYMSVYTECPLKTVFSCKPFKYQMQTYGVVNIPPQKKEKNIAV